MDEIEQRPEPVAKPAVPPGWPPLRVVDPVWKDAVGCAERLLAHLQEGEGHTRRLKERLGDLAPAWTRREDAEFEVAELDWSLRDAERLVKRLRELREYAAACGEPPS